MSNSFEALSNTAKRWQELERLRKLEELVKQHPEWVNQDPQLKQLIKASA